MSNDTTISQVLELSTAHLTFDEAQNAAVDRVAAMTCDYGWLFSTASTVDETELPNLKKALEFAKSLGCSYLRLDSDGPTTPALAQFEW
jgi:hypothetical protein